MKGEYKGIIIGISIGVAIGAVLATWILLCMRLRRKHAKVQVTGNEQRGLSLPIRFNAADSSTVLSDSTFGGHDSVEIIKRTGFFFMVCKVRKELACNSFWNSKISLQGSPEGYT